MPVGDWVTQHLLIFRDAPKSFQDDEFFWLQ
jgi:hypothetical protein